MAILANDSVSIFFSVLPRGPMSSPTSVEERKLSVSLCKSKEYDNA